MTDFPPTSAQPQGGVRRDRLEALAGRVGPSLAALRGRPGLVLLLLFLFAAGLTVFSFQWVLSAALHARKEVTVPDLKGKNLDQSLDVVSPLGLSLAKDAVAFDENSPPGSVLRQAPPAGLKVREGKVIRITLSSGGKVVFVPEIVGKTLAEAQNILRASGMAPGALTQAFSQNHAEGVVLDQLPAVGVVGGRGQMVDMKVSKGPPPEGTLLMPDFLHRPLSLAKAWAADNKIAVDLKDDVKPDLPPGTILDQSPAPDAVVNPGDKAIFTVVASADDGGKGNRWIRYQVPEGAGRVRVRVVMRDERGEMELFEEERDPGTMVEVPAQPQGVARARIFMGGVLVEERVLE